MAYIDNSGIILNKGLTIAQYNSKVADGTISSSDIATQIFDLSDDLPVSQTEKNTWNGKSDFSGSYSDLTNKPTIPTKVSDLTNDSNFIDSTVSNLTNYYTKTDTYTKTEVNSLINGISTMSLAIVTSLPTSNISTTTIYLIAKTTSGTQNVYDEYLYVNSAWEKIGDTEIDLTNYALKTELPTKTSQLTNDSNFVSDASYVHTDNNFTSTYKSNVDSNTTARHTHSNKTILDNTTASFTTELNTKLSGISAGANVNVIETIKVNGTAQTVTSKAVNIEVPTSVTRVWSE